MSILIVGPLFTNCYLLIPKEKAIVIDPGAELKRILKELGEKKLEYIILTHFHKINIEVGGQTHNILAGFSYDIARYGYGVLGQKGFFDNFIVKFDLLKEGLN